MPFPFCQGKDDSKKFPIIDVVVSLHRGEGLGEVSARVEVARGIRLHQNCTSGEKRGVGHERKRARNIRDAEDGGGREDGV